MIFISANRAIQIEAITQLFWGKDGMMIELTSGALVRVDPEHEQRVLEALGMEPRG